MKKLTFQLSIILSLTIVFYMSNTLINQPLLLFFLLLSFYSLISYFSNKPVNIPQVKSVVSDAYTLRIKDFIIQLNTFIAHMDSLDALFPFILENAINLIPGGQAGSLLIYSENTRTFSFKCCKGYDFDSLSKHTLKLEETFIYQYTFGRMEKACIINNPLQFNKQYLGSEKYGAFVESNLLTLKSTLSAPIYIDGLLYGLINLDNITDDSIFTNQDIETIEYLVSQLSIVIKNALLLEKTLFLSRHDSLTKIYNRHFIDESIDRLFLSAKERGSLFTLCIIDMDGLKYINDTFGHSYGDKALLTLSRLLQKYFEKLGCIGRYGGDEFIIAINDLSLSVIDDLILDMLIELEKPINHLEKFNYKLDFSYGLSQYPNDSHQLKDLFKLSDSRMYHHKLSKGHKP